jgi:hypothetical protein
MTDPPPAPSLSVVLIDAAAAPLPDCLEQALERGDVAEIVRAAGPFERLARPFAEAIAFCSGDLVLAVTPDMHLPDTAWPAIVEAARARPDAEAFTLNLQGLAPDPAWRGRRCRSHERNLESLRFAHLLAPGALAVRRDTMRAALANLPADVGADWWRVLTGKIAASAHVADIDATLTRSRRLAGEPAYPSFASPTPTPRRLRSTSRALPRIRPGAAAAAARMSAIWRACGSPAPPPRGRGCWCWGRSRYRPASISTSSNPRRRCRRRSGR